RLRRRASPAALPRRCGGPPTWPPAWCPAPHSLPLFKIWDSDWYGTYSPTSVSCRCTLKSCRCGPAAGSFGAKFPIAETGSVMAYSKNFRGGGNLGTGPGDGMKGGLSALLTAPAGGRTALVEAFPVTATAGAPPPRGGPGFPLI